MASMTGRCHAGHAACQLLLLLVPFGTDAWLGPSNMAGIAWGYEWFMPVRPVDQLMHEAKLQHPICRINENAFSL